MVEVKEKIEVREQPLAEPVVEPAQVDEVGQVLLRAADVLREGGWCQGSLESGGQHCALGALMSAAGYHLFHGKIQSYREPHLYHKADKRLHESLGLKNVRASFWNDRPERTKEEVIEALERAAYGV